MIEGGRVNRISVAVLVDGTYGKNDKGDIAYQPRSKEEIDQIAALVRSAIGFDQKRGDQVEVVNLRFAETPATPISEPSGWLAALQFTKDDIMRAIEMVVMGLLGLVVLFMVVRPLVRRILAPEERAAALRCRPARRRRSWRTPSPPRPRKAAEPTRDGEDDRHRPDPGPGPRPVGAEGRRARRQESERSRFHHPPMDERKPRSLIDRPCHPPCHKRSTPKPPAGTSRAPWRRSPARPAPSADKRQLTGPERAAVLMLALGEQHGAKIWSMLDDDELRAAFGRHVHHRQRSRRTWSKTCLLEFVTRMSASGALMGSYEATERLLQQYLPPERVGAIMDEIRGPAGRNMWEKLSNVQEEVLANYLKNEYPQTVAVVLSKIRPEHAARVLAILPEELALDVVNRMLRMEAVQKEVLERVEQTLRTEFMSNLSQTRRRDAHEVMAEIFNNFDRQTETRFLTSLEEDNRESAERIKTLMFTFDDLIKLDPGSAQTLMRHIEKDKLAVALKGAAEPVRQFFLSNMSTRAAKMLLDDMGAMGPVRLRDVDEAQVLLVNLAKDLAGKGEIVISKTRGEEELIY